MPVQCINVQINGNLGHQPNGEGNGTPSSSWGSSSTNFKGNWNYQGDLTQQKISKYDDLFRKAGKKLDIDWRLIAAQVKQESSFNPKDGSPAKAYGLYQFMPGTWDSHAPKGFENRNYRSDPDKATEAYISLMSKNLKHFSNAASRNDQILLSIQKYHDGHFPPTTTYANYQVPEYLLNIDKNNGNHDREKEAKEYVPKIMKHYSKFGGSIS